MPTVAFGRLVTAIMIAFASICVLGEAVDAKGEFRKGPYLQNVSATSVTVMWESAKRSAGTVRVLSKQPIVRHSEADDIHEVVVTGLSPGKRYRYEVESNGQTRRGEFATAPKAGMPFAFLVFGDSRSRPASHSRVVQRIRREVADFILGTGDMVDDGSKEYQWQRFFDIERSLLKHNVMFPSVGNHDRQGRGRTADNYRKYFSLPENSPDPERYYAFTYGNARFLVLDSNTYSFALTDQTAWIEQQLQAARLDKVIDHIFVSMHHPPYSISLHGGQRQLRHAWTPLFERYGVAAVFSGHDHCYERGFKNGVRYFVSGGGGAPLYPRSRRPSKIDLAVVKYFERVNHYLRVHVFDEFIEVTAIRADGSLIESESWGNKPPPREDLLDEMRKRQARTTMETSSAPAVTMAGAPSTANGNGFGIFGIFGALMMLGAAVVMVMALRRP